VKVVKTPLPAIDVEIIIIKDQLKNVGQCIGINHLSNLLNCIFIMFPTAMLLLNPVASHSFTFGNSIQRGAINITGG